MQKPDNNACREEAESFNASPLSRAYCSFHGYSPNRRFGSWTRPSCHPWRPELCGRPRGSHLRKSSCFPQATLSHPMAFLPAQTKTSGRVVRDRPPYRGVRSSRLAAVRVRRRRQVRRAQKMTARPQTRSAQARAMLTYCTPGVLTGRTMGSEPSSAASSL